MAHSPKGREFRMGGDKCLHRVRFLAPPGVQQLIKSLRGGNRKDRGIDHGRPPFLPARGQDAQSHASNANGRIRRVRIGRAEIEAPESRILAGGEDLGTRESRARPIRFENAREADALGMILAMAERHATRRLEGLDDLDRRQALGRQPSRRIGEGRSTAADKHDEENQKSQKGGRRRSSRLSIQTLTGMMERPSSAQG